MLHSTGWGFPAQPDAGSPGNLAKEPAHICQLSCSLVVYSHGEWAVMVWVALPVLCSQVQIRWFGCDLDRQVLS